MHTVYAIDILPTEDGLFEARCAALNLKVTGTTPGEAEAACLRLIDERTAQTGSAPESIESNRDTRIDLSDDDQGRPV